MSTNNKYTEVLFVGNKMTGKSSFISFAQTGIYFPKYRATTDIIITKIKINDHTFACVDLDISILKLVKKFNYNAAMIFCDIRVLNSITSIESWILFIHRNIGSIPTVIVATYFDEIESYMTHLIYLHKISKRVNLDFVLISSFSGYSIQIPFDILDHKLMKNGI
uniref:Ras family GTPase n=1 Tax=Pithovirus LCPAC001 TaxID=2506585 RepID=A0A481Z197_9VIRU|nr:MAG: Ras family GTPase [Pithovirus LCPAC001]